MTARNDQAIRMARLEAELEAERRRSAEFDQAHRRQLDANRLLITENATLTADLRHANDELRRVNETTVPALQRSLKEAQDELNQERAKLVKYLRTEAQAARNRETNVVLGARNVVKRELTERGNNPPVDDAPATEDPQPNVDNLVHAINAQADASEPPVLLEPAKGNITEAHVPDNEPEDPHADAALVADERASGTTKLLPVTVVEPAAPPPPSRPRLKRKKPSASEELYRGKASCEFLSKDGNGMHQKRILQHPKVTRPTRAARKPVIRARRGSSTTAAHSKPAERPKAVRQLAPKKHGRTTRRPPSAKDPCAHRKCKNPYENEKLVPEGEEIAWIECCRI
ncbi:hypothetical protein AAVH_18599 [Aphelenchoides avenae]|nr:hypothetical protein AAVH_18599 [Aphelenchus avenae]